MIRQTTKQYCGYTLIIEVLALNNPQQTKENHSKENHSNDRRRQQFLNLYLVRLNDSLNCNQDRTENLFLIYHLLWLAIQRYASF